MNYPYYRYIRFLITKRFSYEKIKEVLEDCNLICPDMAEIELLKSEIFDICPDADLKKTLNSKEKLKGVEKFLSHMKTLEVHELWLAESSFKDDSTMAPTMKALDIFNDFKRREELNCFIMNKTPYDEIQMCFSQRSVSVAKVAIDVYRKFFFDLNKMTKKDWVSLLKKMDVFQRRRYMLAMNTDGNRLKYELGFKTRLQYAEALDDVFATAYYKFKDSSKHDGDDISHRNARSWAKTLMDAGDRKGKLQTGSAEDFTKAMKMEFTFDDEQFPSYSDLK